MSVKENHVPLQEMLYLLEVVAERISKKGILIHYTTRFGIKYFPCLAIFDFSPLTIIMGSNLQQSLMKSVSILGLPKP